MRLSRLRLVNYRRFADASIQFPDGLIGIVGRNGAGKSSVIEAILWALFGHDAARTNKDLLKRQAAAPGDDVVVQLEFEVEGIRHTITRRLRGRSLQPEAAVESMGMLAVAPGPNSWEQANLLITRILGFDRASFEATVVAKQGELAALSELRPAQRKKVLLGMLGIDRIDDAVQHARADGRVLDARLTEARRSLADMDALRAELKATDAELSAATASLSKAQHETDAGEKRLAAIQGQEEDLLAARLRDQELRVRLQALQGRLESIWGQRTRLGAEVNLSRERVAQAPGLRARLEGLGDIDQRLVTFERLRHQLEQRDRLAVRRSTLYTELEGLLGRAGDEAAASETGWRTRLAIIQDEGAEIAGQAGRWQAEDAELRARLAEPRPEALDHSPEWSADDCCPTCGRALGDAADRLRHQFQEALRSWAQARTGFRGRLAQVTAGLRTTSERRAANAASRAEAEAALRTQQDAIAGEAVRHARIEQLRADVSSVDRELSENPAPAFDPAEQERLIVARAERDRLRDAVSRIEETERRVSRMQDEDRLLAAQEQEIVRERETASRELRAASYENGSWEKVHAEAEAVRGRTEAARRDLIQWRERREARERQRARLQETLQKFAARQAEIQVLESDVRLLDVLVARRGEDGVLPEFRSHLIGRLRPALSRAAGQLLGEMTRGRYSDLLLDEEYGATLYDEGVALPLERFSGGEVDVCNLALRLAVSELVANARGRTRLQFVALDEVLGSQDEERRGCILNALHSLATVFRQVFVVTHTEDVRERLEHVLRVEDAGDGTSRFVATWGEEGAESDPGAVEPEPAVLVASARA